MKDVMIVGTLRTPVGCLQGALSCYSAIELGSVVPRALTEQIGIDPQSVDEVIPGQVLTAGTRQNPTRQSAIRGKLSNTVSVITISDVCDSGLKTLHLAAQAIQCGEADVVITGGQENMSRAPHVLVDNHTDAQLGNSQLIDSLIYDGLWGAFDDYHMGAMTENLTREYGISHELRDAWALSSQHRARKAIDSGRLHDEIVPVITEHNGATRIMDTDEQPRVDASTEGLVSLQPTFGCLGSVIAGNASSINDGAAAVIMMSKTKAFGLRLPILARIRVSASVEVGPVLIGTVPVHATRRYLERTGWRLDDVDLIETNKAFAAQAISAGWVLEWDEWRANVNDGATALGHPIGVFGCRILVSLVHEMIKHDTRKGLATLCIDGGRGVALTAERA